MKYSPTATAPLHWEESKNIKLVICPLNDCKSLGSEGVTPSILPTPSVSYGYKLTAIQYCFNTGVDASSCV